MGPQVKTGTHSVRRGTPSVPVAALAGGEPCHPSSYPSPQTSIPPSVHPLAGPPSRRSTVLNHPGMRPPPPPLPVLSSLSFSLHPVTNSSLAPTSLPSHLPFPPLLLCLLSTRQHSSLSPFSPSLINHPYMTPGVKLLNYHTFVMSRVRTRDSV